MIVTPNKALADNDIVIPLPEAEAHVRHGSFNLDEISSIQLPNGVSNVRFQRFYKNGFVEGLDDLCVVTFQFENEVHIVQFKFYELCANGYLKCGESKSGKNNFRLI